MDIKYMKSALKEAQKAYDIDEVPVGCVIVKDEKIIARAHNKRESIQQSTAHAEILAINKACKKLKTWRLDGCELYVTLEPCLMCSGAIMQSRIKTVVFGASDPKGGMCGSCGDFTKIKGFNHYPTIIDGVMSEDCSKILKNFFKNKRSSIEK